MKTRPIAERFWEKVRKSSGCWEWTAYRNALGYGAIAYGKPRRPVLAHRVAWELTHGAAPSPDVEVCHRCDNPSCVRPDHLFLGSHRDNMLDMIAKGRRVAAMEKRTHCPQGHPYDEANTYRAKSGARLCRACHRDWMRSYAAGRRDEMKAKNKAWRDQKRIRLAAENAARTHCDAGHALDEANTFLRLGKRLCLTCRRAARSA